MFVHFDPATVFRRSLTACAQCHLVQKTLTPLQGEKSESECICVKHTFKHATHSSLNKDTHGPTYISLTDTSIHSVILSDSKANQGASNMCR